MSISACSMIKTNELTKNESTSLKGKTLIFTLYDTLPDFSATTAANVQFGLLGALAAIDNGNLMIANNKIKDPAVEVAKALADGLAKNHNVKVFHNNNIVSKSNEIVDLVSLYNQYDYILDVRTLGWGSIYYPSDWNNYKVRYAVHARLIDRNKKIVIAEELCQNTPEFVDTDKAPSYDDLESGASIKQELAKSVIYCVDYIRTMTKLHNQRKIKKAVNSVTEKSSTM